MFSLWKLVKDTAAELISDNPDDVEEAPQHSLAVDAHVEAAAHQADVPGGVEQCLIDTHAHAVQRIPEPRTISHDIGNDVGATEILSSPPSQARPRAPNEDALKTPACQRLMVRGFACVCSSPEFVIKMGRLY
jgi:hypothetical protein